MADPNSLSLHADKLIILLQPEVPITLEVLHLVFSAFGFVHKIATFEKQAGLQALVQFDDPATAEQVGTGAIRWTSWQCLTACEICSIFPK